MFRFFAFIGFLCIAFSARAADSAVIVMYHRFGENAYPSTSIRLDQFDAHIRYLQEENFHVLPVTEIVEKLRSGQTLPDKTIGITMDDGYASIYKEAWPRLKAANFPFTLFISTDDIDGNLPDYMTWDQIRELASHKTLVSIGHHSAGHPYLHALSLHDAAVDTAKASRRWEEELGFRPDYYVYPYGEYSLAVRDMIKKQGFKAAFGQQSSVAYPGMDFFQIPRFSLNENYGDLDRFKLIANALPLPVRDVLPEDPYLLQNPPYVGFTLDSSVPDPGNLNCFVSRLGKVDLLKPMDNRYEIRFDQPWPTGRTRLNCTLPAKGGRWYWWGVQLLIPEK